MSFKNNSKALRGVTLVELLVVIAIIVSVLAISVPVVRLATDSNKVASAADQLRSFMISVQADARQNGRAFVIMERNFNNPNLCYRLFRGRPRPDYRGEDFTSYAIACPQEVVRIPIQGANPVDLACEVFYLYNADVNKVRPFQYLSLDGRLERYKIIKARVLPATSDVVSQGVYRPVIKVFAYPNISGPLTLESGMSGLPTTAETTGMRQPTGTPAVWTDWNAAFQQNVAPNENEFWPDSTLWTTSGGFNAASDIHSSTATLFGFSVTQPPFIDELNFLTLPEGTAIHLDGSGFGTEGVVDLKTPGTVGPGNASSLGAFISPFTQLAWPYNPNVPGVQFGDLEADAATETILNEETVNYLTSLPIDSVARTAYFPMLEFDSEGRLDRAFVSSKFTTSLLSLAPDIVRTAPIRPVSPMYLQLGKDVDRLTPVDSDDYWVILNQQTSRLTVLKAEDSPLDIDGDGVYTVRDSRLTNVGGSSE